MTELVAWWAFGILITASVAGCSTFLVLYQRYYPWWRSEAGRNLFAFVAALGAVDTVWLTVLVARPGWASMLRLVLILAYTPQPFLIWWRVSMMVRVHRREMRDPARYPLSVGGLADTALLSSLMDYLPDAIVGVDGDGKILVATARVQDLFGWPPSLLVGLPLSTVIPPGRRDIHAQDFAQFMAAPKRRLMGDGHTFVGLHRDGSEVPVRVSIGPVESWAGIRAVAVIREAPQ